MILDHWHIFTTDYGQFPKPYTAFATLLDMLLFMFLTVNLSRAQKEFNVQPPSTEGPEAFQRIFRTHATTAEELVLHLPLLWIASCAMDDVFAGALGIIWFFGRCLYAMRYYQKASRRTKGFVVSMLANTMLLIGSSASLIASF